MTGSDFRSARRQLAPGAEMIGRTAVLGLVAAGLAALFAASASAADKLSCLPVKHMDQQAGAQSAAEGQGTIHGDLPASFSAPSTP